MMVPIEEAQERHYYPRFLGGRRLMPNYRKALDIALNMVA